MRWVAIAIGVALVTVAPPALRAGTLESDRARLYRETCAACHGIDGRGVSRELVGFEEPLPDFTDCRFAPREPDLDWLAVIHDGGPARGFAPMMAAFGVPPIRL
jgi:hypothetical protein